MNILAIECSLPTASVALHAATPMQRHWSAPRNHDAFLFPALQVSLELLGSAPLPFILVGAGPGSYGGVRVALAAAQGIALVRSSQVVAFSSWEPLSAATGCSVLSDAKRGGWTLRRPNSTPLVLSTQEVLQILAAGEDIRSTESADRLERSGLRLKYSGYVPSAQALIDYWLGLSDAQRNALASLPPEPIYVRPPHITTPKHLPWEVQK